MMTFQWPNLLWLLLAVPLMAGLYVMLLRRRKRDALHFPNLRLIKESLDPSRRFRRHVPPLLLLLGVVVAIVAIARPVAVVPLPFARTTVIMAIDVSLSMQASDIEPSRLAAAKDAAKAFVQQQPASVEIGIVSFAGSAALVQPPTRQKDQLIDAIDRLVLQRATAIGSGMLVSLAAMFPEEDFDFENALVGNATTSERERARSLDPNKARKESPPKIVPPGSRLSGAIILLTDGRRTTGPDPLQVARIAADRGVRIFTVGFGKVPGTRADVGGYSMFLAFDETTLKSIADITRADYFYAPTADELNKVYDTLSTRFLLEQQKTELSSLFAALGALFMLIAGTLSLLWFGRIL